MYTYFVYLPPIRISRYVGLGDFSLAHSSWVRLETINGLLLAGNICIPSRWLLFLTRVAARDVCTIRHAHNIADIYMYNNVLNGILFFCSYRILYFLTRLFLSTSNLILFIKFFFSVRFVLRIRIRSYPHTRSWFYNYADGRCGFRIHVLINVENEELVIIDRFSLPNTARPAATIVARPPPLATATNGHFKRSSISV